MAPVPGLFGPAIQPLSTKVLLVIETL